MVPRRHNATSCLCEEEAANVERSDHIPVPHSMLVLVRVAHIIAELGFVVVGVPPRTSPGRRAAPVRAGRIYRIYDLYTIVTKINTDRWVS